MFKRWQISAKLILIFGCSWSLLSCNVAGLPDPRDANTSLHGSLWMGEPLAEHTIQIAKVERNGELKDAGVVQADEAGHYRINLKPHYGEFKLVITGPKLGMPLEITTAVDLDERLEFHINPLSIIQSARLYYQIHFMNGDPVKARERVKNEITTYLGFDPSTIEPKEIEASEIAPNVRLLAYIKSLASIGDYIAKMQQQGQSTRVSTEDFVRAVVRDVVENGLSDGKGLNNSNYYDARINDDLTLTTHTLRGVMASAIAQWIRGPQNTLGMAIENQSGWLSQIANARGGLFDLKNGREFPSPSGDLG